MTSDKNPVEYYNEAVEMLQAMRQELQAKLDDIEGIKTKLVITDTKLQLTQTELKETQVKLKATEDYIDNTLVGSVTAFAMTTPPEGWLTCNGSAVSRTNYARLFEKIGTTFGEGDGETTFNLPDLRGVFIRGWDTDNRFDLERKFGSYQDDQMQSHTHKDSGHSHSSSVSTDGNHSHSGKIADAGYHNHSGSVAENGSHSHSGSTSSNGFHNHSFNLEDEWWVSIYKKGGSCIYYKGNGTEESGGKNFLKPDGYHSHTFSTNFAGSHSHNLNINSAGSHSHNLDINSAGYHSHTVSINNSFASLGNPTSSEFGEPRHGHENRTKNVALIYCIKY